MIVNRTGTRVLDALCSGPVTLEQVVMRAHGPADEVLTILRRLAAEGHTLCGRKRSAGRPSGPLYWYLVEQPLPPFRAEPKPPLAAVVKMVEAAPGGHDNGPMSPLEILSRLACRGGFPNLTGAVGCGPSITREELLYLVASVPDKLGVEVAIAIACKSTLQWPRVHELAYPRLLMSVQGSRALRPLIREDNRSRLRYVLHDAFHDLARWHKAVPWCDAAKAARMRRSEYTALYEHTARELCIAAENAARQVVERRRDEEYV